MLALQEIDQLDLETSMARRSLMPLCILIWLRLPQ